MLVACVLSTLLSVTIGIQTNPVELGTSGIGYLTNFGVNT
jgi:hypothetical protein